jgi:hypothetical protein
VLLNFYAVRLAGAAGQPHAGADQRERRRSTATSISGAASRGTTRSASTASRGTTCPRS